MIFDTYKNETKNIIFVLIFAQIKANNMINSSLKFKIIISLYFKK